MTIQYLAPAVRVGNFGVRQIPITNPDAHVISLFGVPGSGVANSKQFGVNGKPGDIYTVPKGRKLTIYQMDIAALGTGAIGDFEIRLVDFYLDVHTEVAAFYPDVTFVGAVNENFETLFSEKNDINRPFYEDHQPQCYYLGAGSFSFLSLELYGIEEPA